MTDEPPLPGRLARLWTRTRDTSPTPPTCRHFVLHGAVVVAAVPLEFFYAAIQDNAGPPWQYAALLFPWVIEQIVFPISLINALWRCLRLGWRPVAAWLGRPALLVLALLIIHSPLRRQGQIWSFEKRLPRYNVVVADALAQHPEPLGPTERLGAPLPKGAEGLTTDGEVRLVGHPGGMALMFPTKAGVDLYVLGQPPKGVGDHVRYGENWYLSPRSNFILDALNLRMVIALYFLPPLRSAYSFAMRLFQFL